MVCPQCIQHVSYERGWKKVFPIIKKWRFVPFAATMRLYMHNISLAEPFIFGDYLRYCQP